MGVSYKECTVQSATIIGVDAIGVSVEVVISNGMPGFSIVGMTDVAIQEARERIRAALRGCGFTMPNSKITVNLAPGFLKKSGSGFDLPIAVGLLVVSGQVSPELILGNMFVGELSLEGKVRPVLGMLAHQEYARDKNLNLICAQTNMFTGELYSKCVKVIDSLQNLRTGSFEKLHAENLLKEKIENRDFIDVGGHEQVKRALQIAAAGSHGVMMVGPPGAGKTMLASRLPSILPPLTETEMLETVKVYSIVGESPDKILGGIRPFRAPHHCATAAGLVGGGSPVRPGELSLAHNGVLFLDELAEFKPSVLQALRKPIEDGTIVIVRADGRIVLPSRFMLVAASNPCPCGYFGDDIKQCSCTQAQVSAYQNRIGGPLIDRMDICVDVWRTSFENVVRSQGDTSSAQLRAGVLAGRDFALERTQNQLSVLNGIPTKDLMKMCCLDSESESFLKSMTTAHSMSGRGIASVLRVSRTIADIDQSAAVQIEHLSEALNLRLRTRG